MVEDDSDQTLNVPTPSSASDFLEGSLAEYLSGPLQRSQDSLELPKEIGAYSLLREIGRGGFGVVYQALDNNASTERNRTVALKLMHVGIGPADWKRFYNEVNALKSLSHPNIVALLDSGRVAPNLAYLVMPIVDGLAIDVYCQSNVLTWRVATELLISTCRAIEHAHSRGVLHCDLKPSNILVTKDGEVVVTDFGLVRFFEEADGQLSTLSTSVKGTPAYMAPEQLLGSLSAATDRTRPTIDVYGLGATFCKILTGQPPRPATSALSAIVQAVSGDELPRFDKKRLQLACPTSLCAVVEKAIDPEPSFRYADVSKLRHDLENVICLRPTVAKRVSAVRRFVLWTRREPLAVAALGCLLVTAVAALALGWGWMRAVESEGVAMRRSLNEAISLVDEYQKTLGRLQPGQRVNGTDRLKILTRLREQRRLLAAASPNDRRTQYGFAQACFLVGEYLIEAGDRNGARAELRSATDHFAELLRKYPDDLALQFDMFQTHFKLGSLYHSVHELDDGMRHYALSRSLIEGLVAKKPDNLDYLDCLSAQYAATAMYELESHQPQEAIEMYQQSLDLAVRLRKLSGSLPRHWRHRLDAEWGMERICLRRGQHAQAIEHAQQAVAFAEDAVAVEPDDWVFRLDQLRAWTILAVTAHDSGEFELMEQSLRDSEPCVAWLSEHRPDHEELNELVAERQRIRLR